jgi:glycerol-3-phosphate dehydrogenase
MSTSDIVDVEVAVIGAGVVGCATALALARRGVSVALLEAEPAPGLAASGTNSGILTTGFDSAPGELETELILRSATLRPEVLVALEIPVLRCGAVMTTRDEAQRGAIAALAANARRNGVPVLLSGDGTLSVPGETVTDPVAYTLALAGAGASASASASVALAGAAQRHGAELRTGWLVTAVDRANGALAIGGADGEELSCRVAVNCAGLEADAVARLAGDDSFEIHPRKGEFLVFDPVGGEPLERILLPVPTTRTRGVLVFPTIDGKVVAGPTAVDQEDKHDWSVRPEARGEILAQAGELYPQLRDAEPVAAYAGLRPAGRGVNYRIEPSRACRRLINVAAIRSTGLSASLAIAEAGCRLVAELGVAVGGERPLEPGKLEPVAGPWWRRTAEHRSR